ncbi:hypothetical protein D5S17_14730 [Pseudonocardiaceae bacterium YIM PH 21723]|nr:hypothetical protein D5S17_14730 [Pseudonocardiaceae bacterium YIM PH 21723]
MPRHSPDLRLADGRPATVVGEHTWLWTEPVAWSPQRKRLDVGPVWAEVIATPVAMEFTPGDGSQAIRCAGPGTAFDRVRFGVHAASPDCDYVYQRSSFGKPDDQVTAEYAITWQVTWTGSTGAAPAGGTLAPLTSRATARFAVAEIQALRAG